MNSALLPSLMAFAIIALDVYILVREVGLYLKSYSKGCGVDYSTDKIHTPEEIFKIIGVEIKEKEHNNSQKDVEEGLGADAENGAIGLLCVLLIS